MLGLGIWYFSVARLNLITFTVQIVDAIKSSKKKSAGYNPNRISVLVKPKQKESRHPLVWFLVLNLYQWQDNLVV